MLCVVARVCIVAAWVAYLPDASHCTAFVSLDRRGLGLSLIFHSLLSRVSASAVLPCLHVVTMLFGLGAVLRRFAVQLLCR